ncbi:unnamed protein product [Ceratitis capitata]|uniref:(Mediterranean fruit fly) hypothetical protein n=1 Tax=Ceratitis capitata TaxID=7213 RepID=A0A811U235_CERCA|nr:unnamed protein product [Ceratitis capitata]
MRRDLRLYWRALALLGALLSIIIDWPGMMVCAMPAILLQPNATTTINATATMQQQQRQHIDHLMAANASFHNATTTTNTNNTHRSGFDVDAVGGLQIAEDSFALNIYLNTIGNGSLNSSSYGESEQQQQQTEEQEEEQQEAEHTTEESPKSSQARNTATLAAVNTNSKHSAGNESEHHEGADYAPAQHAPPASSDDQLHNAQRIKVLNLISNKRKRKKFSDQNDDDEEAALEAIETTTTTTANNKPLSVSANSISNNSNNFIHNNINNNNNNQNIFKNYENQQMAAAPKRTLSQLENTTHNNKNNYNNNNNIYINYIEEQVPATIDEEDESAGVAAVTEPSSLFTTTSSTGSDYDDQNERSSSRTSTSYSLTTATPDEDADLLQNSAPQLPAFKFASAQHTALLLSRTERSVRQAAVPSAAQTDKNIEMRARAPSIPNRRAIRHHGGGGATNNNGGIVRRSSDGSPKSRRLNNFRNINGSRHLMPSNLDRNERSTISHLSGLSRKIQIYIKNRFIQLLPDGTVNGTQDDQSDYNEILVVQYHPH